MHTVNYENSALLTPERTMEIVLETIGKIVSYELGVILSLEDDNFLQIRHGQGNLYTPDLRDYRISLNDRPELAQVVEKGEVKLFSDGAHRDTYDEVMDLPHDHSCMVAPLHIEGKILGVLTLDHRQCNVFTPQIVKITKALAHVIALALAQSIAADALSVEREALICERNTLLADLSHTLDGMVGASDVWMETLEKIRLVATTNAPVMILGETGTGKEQAARAIHTLSPRAQRTFVAMNCSALMNNLVESELFGHERGAFTGAVARRRGRFELANNGSLFLDEIADLPVGIQPKLLRALQDGTFERVGGEVTITADVRIICATNLDLPKAIREGSFREDLFYRLNVFPIHMPPLRERGDDILLLSDYFLNKIAKKFGRKRFKLSPAATNFLRSQSWPGNVRQLQNTLERAVIICQEETIQPKHLEGYQEPAIVDSKSVVEVEEHEIETLDQAISRHIKKALNECEGKIYGADGAAALLGLKPTTLQSKMRKLSIHSKK